MDLAIDDVLDAGRRLGYGQGASSQASTTGLEEFQTTSDEELTSPNSTAPCDTRADPPAATDQSQRITTALLGAVYNGGLVDPGTIKRVEQLLNEEHGFREKLYELVRLPEPENADPRPQTEPQTELEDLEDL